MKIGRVISKIFKPTPQLKAKTVEVPPSYDSKNATLDEFKAYVHYLAKNNINRTFYEPERLVTEAERKAQKQKEEELKPFRKFVHHLAENNINRTFYC